MRLCVRASLACGLAIGGIVACTYSVADVCTAPAATAPCSRIQRFTGTQRIDGSDDDLLCLGAATLPQAEGGTDFTVRVRVGWSETGLHVHAHIDDAVRAPDPSDTKLWDGDSFELYLSPMRPNQVDYDGDKQNPGALAVVIARDGRGTVKYPTAHTYAPPPEFKVREVSGGWEVETLVRWDQLHPPQSSPSAGQVIGFDIAAGDSDTPNAPKRTSYVLLGALPWDDGGCSQPSCNALMWCLPTLE